MADIIEKLSTLVQRNCSSHSSSDLDSKAINRYYKDIIALIVSAVLKDDNTSQRRWLLLICLLQDLNSGVGGHLIDISDKNVPCITLAKSRAKKLIEHSESAKRLKIEHYTVTHILHGLLCRGVVKMKTASIVASNGVPLHANTSYNGDDVDQIFSSYKVDGPTRCPSTASRGSHQRVCINPCHYDARDINVGRDSLTAQDFPFELFDDFPPSSSSGPVVTSILSSHYQPDAKLVNVSGINNDLKGLSLIRPTNTNILTELLEPHSTSSDSVFTLHAPHQQAMPPQSPGGRSQHLSEYDADDSPSVHQKSPNVPSPVHQQGFNPPDNARTSGTPYDNRFKAPAMLSTNDGIGLGNREDWCSITYHEHDQRIGETFNAQVNHSTIYVDGFTEPQTTSNRYSIGGLSNIRRTAASTMVRKHIGHGIELRLESNCAIIKCLSVQPVFVQSPNANAMYNWAVETVVKVPQNKTLIIFDTQKFTSMLTESIPGGFDEVYGLTRMCTIRVSFVKGWGQDYKRQSIRNTPCWIELRMNRPLQWIDTVLGGIGGPNGYIGSCS